MKRLCKVGEVALDVFEHFEAEGEAREISEFDADIEKVLEKKVGFEVEIGEFCFREEGGAKDAVFRVRVDAVVVEKPESACEKERGCIDAVTIESPFAEIASEVARNEGKI